MTTRQSADDDPRRGNARGQAGVDTARDNNPKDSATPATARDPAALPLGVWCRKSNESLILFKRYPTHDEARKIVEALGRVGCSAMVIANDEEVPT